MSQIIIKVDLTFENLFEHRLHTLATVPHRDSEFKVLIMYNQHVVDIFY